jgi:hypothetical protein
MSVDQTALHGHEKHTTSACACGGYLAPPGSRVIGVGPAKLIRKRWDSPTIALHELTVCAQND